MDDDNTVTDNVGEENDNSTDSSSETNEEEVADETTTQSDEGENSNAKKDKGFADNPRWKEREDDWKKRFNEQESRFQEDLSKMRQDLEEKLKPNTPTNTKIPSWFGGDEDQWREYQEDQNRLLAEAEKRALNKIESKKTEEEKRVQEATEYFNSQIDEIESNGEKVDRNKLVKYAMDNDVVDSKGRWNWKVAYQLLKSSSQTKPQSKDDRKKLADASSSSKNSETPKDKPFMTSEDFKGANRIW